MKIASVRGIGVYIHWSFWILAVVYIFPILGGSGPGTGVGPAAVAALFLGGIFAAIVAHEFGHAAAARRCGIETADITLLPVGGVARLKRLPESPMQELVIALAGPVINLVIALALFLLLQVGIKPGISAPTYPGGADIFTQWIVANCLLFGFNLLPAFPMDGGRVLRGLLAMNTSYLRATEVAARVGRWMSLVFIIAAIYFSIFPLFILAIFVFVSGTLELLQVRFREAMRQSAQQAQPAQGRPNAPWFHQAWPGQGRGYEADQEGSHPADGGVIDAVDVREIPQSHHEAKLGRQES